MTCIALFIHSNMSHVLYTLIIMNKELKGHVMNCFLVSCSFLLFFVSREKVTIIILAFYETRLYTKSGI